jgi:predicted site-specific integrase-resolvase
MLTIYRVLFMNDMLSIGQAAAVIGVSVSTMRRWDKNSSFPSMIRTQGGHRRYSLKAIRQIFFGESSVSESRQTTVLYSRVSSSDQLNDLERQAERLRTKAVTENWKILEIRDQGSGINCKKRGLKKLLSLICNQKIIRVVLTHKDRLLRFGSELIFQICKEFGIDVVILDDYVAKDFNEELAAEIIEIITVSSARLYGKRSHQNRKRREAEARAA